MIRIFSAKADYSRVSVTLAKVSPIIAINMFRKVTCVIKVAKQKMIQACISPPYSEFLKRPSVSNSPILIMYWLSSTLEKSTLKFFS